VLGRLSVWELREGAEDSSRAQVKDPHLLTTADVGHRAGDVGHRESELVRIEVTGGNYGK